MPPGKESYENANIGYIHISSPYRRYEASSASDALDAAMRAEGAVATKSRRPRRPLIGGHAAEGARAYDDDAGRAIHAARAAAPPRLHV